MCAYGTLNYTRSCSNKKVFDTLKEEFGYRGFIMSDWGAMVGNDSEQFALSGLDMEVRSHGHVLPSFSVKDFCNKIQF